MRTRKERIESDIVAYKGYYIRRLYGMWYIFEDKNETDTNKALFGCYDWCSIAKRKITAIVDGCVEGYYV